MRYNGKTEKKNKGDGEFKMDLSKKNKLDTVTVFDLMNNNFYIPDYQRGYRWTSFEVGKLLADLEDYFEYHTDGSTFYCLQPLVVFYNKEQNAWEVIDGQQRLTTLYLILSQKRERLKEDNPSMELFTLSYQSRPDSQEYLFDIDENKKNDNIDYYHMYRASEVIKDFLPNSKLGAGRFVDAIVNVNNSTSRPSVKFIWYDVTEEIKSAGISSEEKFSDLNIGKIGLTNAELIKALFLDEVSNNNSEALRIASEWDNIEHALQDDVFWSFIHGEDTGRYATRIEFLFDIIKGKSDKEQNDYFTFDAYTVDLKTRKIKIETLWKEILGKYYLFKGWFENKKLYHIVGYLRYKKQDISRIEQIYNDPQIADIDAFFEKLKSWALELTVGNDRDSEIRELNYDSDKDKKKIYDILTLFNVLSVIECKKDDVRFSFDEFYKHSWDIEHINSQTPKEKNGDGRQDWIVCNLEYFSGVNYNYCEVLPDGRLYYKYKEDFEQYKKDVMEAPNRGFKIGRFSVGEICDHLLELFSSKTSITESVIYTFLRDNVFNQDLTFRYEGNIGNLVLLDQGTNRGYKNAFFPVKRKWIYRREHEGIYILPCTKNVFSKNYSDMIFDLMNWSNNDAEAYMKEIERVISNAKTQL